jgi:hypothetical protein
MNGDHMKATKEYYTILITFSYLRGLVLANTVTGFERQWNGNVR